MTVLLSAFVVGVHFVIRILHLIFLFFYLVAIYFASFYLVGVLSLLLDDAFLHVLVLRVTLIDLR